MSAPKANADACEIGDFFPVAAGVTSQKLTVSRPMLRAGFKRVAMERMTFERIDRVDRFGFSADVWVRIS